MNRPRHRCLLSLPSDARVLGSIAPLLIWGVLSPAFSWHLPPLSLLGLLWVTTFLLSYHRVELPKGGHLSSHYLGSMAASMMLPSGWAGLVSASAHNWRLGRSLAQQIGYRGLLALQASLGSAAYHALPELAGVLVLIGLQLAPIALSPSPAVPFSLKTTTSIGPKTLLPFLSLYFTTAPFVFIGAKGYEELFPTPHKELNFLLFMAAPWHFSYVFSAQNRLFNVLRSTLESIMRILEAKDPYTAFHSDRVAAIALDIAKELGLPPERQREVFLGALLHDLGKIGVPDRILLKEGPLEEEEWAVVKSHPVVAERLLAPFAQYLGKAKEAVLHHHERWEGGGYPDGLAGHEIPLYARIVAVADTYEALTSKRPYREPLAPEEALSHLKSESGRSFDPEVVEAFVRAFDKDPPWKERELFHRTRTYTLL